MNAILYLIILNLIPLHCGQSSSSFDKRTELNADQQETGALASNQKIQIRDSIYPYKLFSLSDAEKILGEPAHLSDSATTLKEDVTIYSCSFTANTKDLKSAKTGVVYFLIKQFANDTLAMKEYSFIKKANENHGIKTLYDLGDEAYFHTDGQNFYFIMVRKGNKTFNIKVNKITTLTSLDGFNLIAKKITAAL